MRHDIHLHDGTKLSFVRREPARPARARILFLHALAMDSTNWDQVCACLDDELDIIQMDVRGHGRSTGGDTLSLSSSTDDVAALLAAVGWPSAVLVGCSMGGCIALAVASHRPEQADGLVLVDTTAAYGPDAPAAWSARADKAEREGFGALLAFQRERWFTEGFPERRPNVYRQCVEVFLGNDIRTYKAACAMLARLDLREHIGTVTAPTAVVVGEHDYATPPAMAEALQRGIPDATLHILLGLRHFTPLEAPVEIAAIVSETVARARVAQGQMA